MTAGRAELLSHLEAYYRSCGWPVERASDGTVRALGAAGVTWIGMAVVREDLQNGFDERVAALSDVRMPEGQRCPFELLPAADCEAEVRALLAELGLGDIVSVYSLDAAA